MALGLSQKVRITLLSVLIFVVVSAPFTYRVTDSLLGGSVLRNSVPTWFGLAVHAAVFGFITYALMLIPKFP